MKNKALSIALMASTLGCLLFAYLWIDRSITLSYVSQSADSAIASTHRLERLLGATWAGMSEHSVFELLQAESARYPDDTIVIKKEGNSIWFDETKFNFEQGKLTSIGHSDQ